MNAKCNIQDRCAKYHRQHRLQPKRPQVCLNLTCWTVVERSDWSRPSGARKKDEESACFGVLTKHIQTLLPHQFLLLHAHHETRKPNRAFREQQAILVYNCK